MSVNIYAATNNDGLSQVEFDLYKLLMQYRADNGLPSIPLSSSLTTLAGRHATDTYSNIWQAGLSLPQGANLHSWSDAAYFADHRTPSVMWEAPQRLGTPYPGNGFEISAAGYTDIEAALDGWKGSAGHNNVILNKDIWTDADWGAIGVGVHQTESYDFSLPYGGMVYHVWFGREADPAGPPELPVPPVQPAPAPPAPAAPPAPPAEAQDGADAPGTAGGDAPAATQDEPSGSAANGSTGSTGAASSGATAGTPQSGTGATQTQPGGAQAAPTLSFASGQSELRVQSPDDLFGATLRGVGADKSLVFEGQAFGTGQVSFDAATGVLSLDLDRDGTADGSVTLADAPGGGSFLATRSGAQTSVTFTKGLPDLGDKQKVAAEDINGVANQDFLTGDGATKFEVTLKEGASAQNRNMLGVYEVDGTGAIVNTKMLFGDTSGPAGSAAVLSDVAAGHALGFFLLQDGARELGGLSSQDTFSFTDRSGGSAEIRDGAGLRFTIDGEQQDVTVLHSYQASLNPGGRTHVLSGVEPGGQSLILGFEDTSTRSDQDFQDVIVEITPFDTVFT